MLQRLKSLPLTILLTILIWMYAEAQSSSVPHDEESEMVRGVPVSVPGDPALLARYQISVIPKMVDVTVSGSAASIKSFREKLHRSLESAEISASVEIKSSDPTGKVIAKQVQYHLPSGLSRASAVDEVTLELTDHR
jgi:hypothetical protein